MPFAIAWEISVICVIPRMTDSNWTINAIAAATAARYSILKTCSRALCGAARSQSCAIQDFSIHAMLCVFFRTTCCFDKTVNFAPEKKRLSGTEFQPNGWNAFFPRTVYCSLEQVYCALEQVYCALFRQECGRQYNCAGRCGSEYKPACFWGLLFLLILYRVPHGAAKPQSLAMKGFLRILYHIEL